MEPERLLIYLQEQQNNLRNDIREMLLDSNKTIYGKIQDEVEKIDVKMDTVIKHQEGQNGSLARHEAEINKLGIKQLLITSHQKNCVALKPYKNWKTTLTIFLLLVLTLDWAYDNIPWDKLFAILKELV